MAVLLAFSLEQAARVTRLSERRIRYWDNTGVVSPTLLDDDSGGAHSRVYSFRDLVGLRTVGELRDTFGVSLQTLRQIGQRLRVHAETPWSELRFFVSGNKLFFRDSESRLMLSALNPEQIALVDSLDLQMVAFDIERRSNDLVRRSKSQEGEIVKNRYVLRNTPVIAGTRVPTSAILEFHQAGYTVPEIIREYPRLTAVDVEAVIERERVNRSAAIAS